MKRSLVFFLALSACGGPSGDGFAVSHVAARAQVLKCGSSSWEKCFDRLRRPENTYPDGDDRHELERTIALARLACDEGEPWKRCTSRLMIIRDEPGAPSSLPPKPPDCFLAGLVCSP